MCFYTKYKGKKQ